MFDSGRARCHVADNYVNLISSRRKWQSLLIGGLAILCFAEFLWSCSCNNRVFENANATTGHRSNSAKNVHAGLLETATIFKHEVAILSLNRKSSYYPFF